MVIAEINIEGNIELNNNWLLVYFLLLYSLPYAWSKPKYINDVSNVWNKVNIVVNPNCSGSTSHVVTGTVIKPIIAPPNGPIANFNKLLKKFSFLCITLSPLLN